MIVLPFPPSGLSGHNKGNHWSKGPLVKRHREWAFWATMEANPVVPPVGDIPIIITFVPPNNRGDRLNYPIRIKPYCDGIADALGVNDKRFVPQFVYADPEAPGRVEVRFG